MEIALIPASRMVLRLGWQNDWKALTLCPIHIARVEKVHVDRGHVPHPLIPFWPLRYLLEILSLCKSEEYILALSPAGSSRGASFSLAICKIHPLSLVLRDSGKVWYLSPRPCPHTSVPLDLQPAVLSTGFSLHVGSRAFEGDRTPHSGTWLPSGTSPRKTILPARVPPQREERRIHPVLTEHLPCARHCLGTEETSVHKTDRYSCPCGAYVIAGEGSGDNKQILWINRKKLTQINLLADHPTTLAYPQFKIYVLFSSGGLIQIIMALMTALLRPVGLVIEFSRDLFKLLFLKNPWAGPRKPPLYPQSHVRKVDLIQTFD